MEKIFINARIKTLRKHLKLSQAEFGERIGITNKAISAMEKKGGIISDRNITLICEKYHVSRAWLTEGKGEMFAETEDTLFARFAKENNLNEDEQTAARFFLRLDPEIRRATLQYVRQLAAELAAKDAAKAARAAEESEREKLHRRLDEELDKEKAAPSAFFFTGSDAAAQ